MNKKPNIPSCTGNAMYMLIIEKDLSPTYRMSCSTISKELRALQKEQQEMMLYQGAHLMMSIACQQGRWKPRMFNKEQNSHPKSEGN